MVWRGNDAEVLFPFSAQVRRCPIFLAFKGMVSENKVRTVPRRHPPRVVQYHYTKVVNLLLGVRSNSYLL